MMNLRPTFILIAACNAALTLVSPPVIAQTKPQAQQVSPQTQPQRQGMRRHSPIYGYDLMTAEERTEHRNKMRSLKTWEEREQFRKAHHEQMQARAKERGIALPDPPPMRRRGHRMQYGGGPGR
jgi:hypothetical protein